MVQIKKYLNPYPQLSFSTNGHLTPHKKKEAKKHTWILLNSHACKVGEFLEFVLTQQALVALLKGKKKKIFIFIKEMNRKNAEGEDGPVTIKKGWDPLSKSFSSNSFQTMWNSSQPHKSYSETHHNRTLQTNHTPSCSVRHLPPPLLHSSTLFQTSIILFVRPNFIDTSTIHQTHTISFKLSWNKFWNIFLVFHRLPIQPLFRTVQTTTSRCDGFQSFTGRRVSCLIGSYDQCFWFRSSWCGWICLDWWLLSSLIEQEQCPCWRIWKLCRPYEMISVNHNVDFELTQLEKRAWISFEHHHCVVTYSKTRFWIPIFNSTLLFRFRICELCVSILFGLLSVFMQVMSLIQGLDLILFMSRHRWIPYYFDYATITGCSSAMFCGGNISIPISIWDYCCLRN